jgi:hypothetical protein
MSGLKAWQRYGEAHALMKAIIGWRENIVFNTPGQYRSKIAG